MIQSLKNLLNLFNLINKNIIIIDLLRANLINLYLYFQ